MKYTRKHLEEIFHMGQHLRAESGQSWGVKLSIWVEENFGHTLKADSAKQLYYRARREREQAKEARRDAETVPKEAFEELSEKLRAQKEELEGYHELARGIRFLYSSAGFSQQDEVLSELREIKETLSKLLKIWQGEE